MRKKLQFFIILILGAVSFAAMYGTAQAAKFYFSPAGGNFASGGRFAVSVMINTEGVNINAAQGTISYPTQTLKVDSISTEGSVFKFWSQDPAYSNSSGNITFGGGLPSPGVSSPSVKVITVIFRAVSEGTGAVHVENGSILANDGTGTDLFSGSQDGSYKIGTNETPPPLPIDTPTNGLPGKPNVQSKTHPDENSWYNQSSLDVSWQIPAGVSGVSYVLVNTANYSAAPNNKGLVSGASYDLTKFTDGIWYFYAQFKNDNGWGDKTRRKVKIDRTAPDPVSVSRTDQSDPTNPQPLFTFTSEDAASGIKMFNVKIDGGDWADASGMKQPSGSYALPLQLPGDHSLTVQAVDFAGNTSQGSASFSVASIESPIIISYPKSISSGEYISVRGTARPHILVKLHLVKADSKIDFETKSDSSGDWTADYRDKVPSGTWTLTATAVDSRGAVSNPTPPYSIDVKSIFGRFTPYIVEWGVVGLIILLVIALLFAITYALLHRFLIWRLLMKKDLRKLKAEIIKDLHELEKEVDSHNRNSKAAKRKLETLESELEREMDKIT